MKWIYYGNMQGVQNQTHVDMLCNSKANKSLLCGCVVLLQVMGHFDTPFSMFLIMCFVCKK